MNQVPVRLRQFLLVFWFMAGMAAGSFAFAQQGAPLALPAPTLPSQEEALRILEPGMNHYEVLGLDPRVEHTPQEIKAAARRMGSRFHPDRQASFPSDNPNLATREQLEAAFKEISNAQRILKNPESRAAYDARLGLRMAPSPSAPPVDDMTLTMPVRGTDSAVNVKFDPSTPEQIQMHSPAAFRNRAAGDLEMRKQQCMKHGGLHGFAYEFAEEYPSDFVGFLIGMGTVSAQELVKDPARWSHYWEQNITDPWAHVNMAIFIATQQTAETIMSLMGLRLDECRYILKGKIPPPETAIQKVFKPLIRPIGMTSGALVSTFAIDMAKDKNVKACVGGLMGIVSKPEADAGCDKAYEEWVAKGKIRKYVPVIMSSMVGTILLESGIGMVKRLGGKVLSATEAADARWAAGVRTVGTVTVKGLRVVMHGVARFFAIGFVMEVAYTAGFFYFQKYLQPYFDEWWGRWTTGQNVTIALNEIRQEIDQLKMQNWHWKRKEKPKECEGVKISQWYKRPFYSSACFDKDPSVEERIKDFAEKNQEWRKFILREVNEAKQNWVDYSLRFSNVYADSYRFYKFVSADLYAKKADPKKSNPLDKALPFDIFDDMKTDNICSIDGVAKTKIATAIQEAKDGIADMKRGKSHRSDASYVMPLENILAGLEATDCSKPLGGMSKMLLEDMRKAGQSDEDIKQMDNELRLRLYYQAMTQVDLILATDSRFQIQTSLPEGADLAQAGNPFARIKRALDDKSPAPPGVAYINSMSKRSEVINQEQFKPKEGQDEAKHPYTVPMGTAGVERPTDFLLASMVCGPEVTPTVEQKIQYHQSKNQLQSFVERPSTILSNPGTFFGELLSKVGLTNKPAAAEVKQEHMTPELKAKAEETYKQSITPDSVYIPDTCYEGGFSLVSRAEGRHASFCPPRLIPDMKVNFCSAKPKNHTGGGAYDIHHSVWDIGNTRYVGLLDIVKRNVREDIIGSPKGAGYSFPTWWKSNVMPSAMKVVKSLREEYDTLMERELFPVLQKTDKIEYNGTKLDMGVNASLRNEINFYLKVIRDTIEASHPAPEDMPKVDEAHRALSALLKIHLELSLGLLSDKETIKKSVETIEKLTAQDAPTVDDEVDTFAKGPNPEAEDPNESPEVDKDNSGKEITSIYQKRYIQAFKRNEAAFRNKIQILGAILQQIDPENVSEEAEATIRGAQKGALEGLDALVTETVGLHQLMSTLDLEMLR